MSAPGRYFASIDAGGSKARAVVVDADGRERGRSLAGSANYHAVGLDQAAAHVRDALDAATHAAGATLPLAGLWIGMAGVDRAGDRSCWLPRLRPLAETLRLTNDAELLLSALEDGVGVTLIAGTGSIALGRDAEARTARAGGWGHVMGDEGSGYDIAQRGLQAAARAADGRGPETALLEALMRHWQVERPSDLIGQVYPIRGTATLARLAGLVLEAARAGDRVAQCIRAQAADELALAALTVGGMLRFSDGRLPLALGGGLLVHEAEFRAQVLRRIRARHAVGQVAVVEDAALSAAQAMARIVTAEAAGRADSIHSSAEGTSSGH